jgi:hypothetical protein
VVRNLQEGQGLFVVGHGFQIEACRFHLYAEQPECSRLLVDLAVGVVEEIRGVDGTDVRLDIIVVCVLS